MGQRRQAREVAVQILYMCDCLNYWNFDHATFTFKHFEFPPQVQMYSEAVVQGVLENLHQIDSEITKSSNHWSINRMARVDRALLRMATFELIFLVDEVPKSVAINEAIEIAKRFGSDESPNFINGVLDKLASSVRPNEIKNVGNLKLRAAS